MAARVSRDASPSIPSVESLQYQRRDFLPPLSKFDLPKTSRHVDIISKFMEQDKPNSDLIASFDLFLDVYVGMILSKLVFYVTGSDKRRVIVPSHVMITKPSLCSEAGKTIPLFPAMARKGDHSYSVRIYAYFTEYRIEDYQELLINPDAIVDIINQSTTPTVIDELPVMLRSKYCHLHDLNDAQLSDRGEMQGNPGGYFIVAGNEYFIRNIEMCRANHPLIFNRKANKGGPSCSITSVDMIGASVVTNVVRGKNAQGMNIIGLTLKGVNRTSDEVKKKSVVTNFIPVIAAMGLVYGFPVMNNLNTIINTMRTMTNPENWKIISNLLSSTILDSQYYMATDRDLLTFILKQFVGELEPEFLQPDHEAAIMLLKQALRGHFDTYVMGIQGLNARERINTVLFLVTIYSEYLGGLRSLTDRNDWAFKRFKVAADDYLRSYNRILLSEYQRIFREGDRVGRRGYRQRSEEPAAKVDKSKYREFSSVGEVSLHWKRTGEGSCGNGSVTNAFVRQFKMSNWGGTSQGSSPTSQLLNNLPGTPIGVYANTRQIFTTTEAKALVVDARSTKMSQVGYGAPTTPQNQNCGLTKSAGQTCRFTYDVPPARILHIIRSITEGHPGYLHIDPQPNMSRILVNGVVRGWANAIELRAYLVNLRRQNLIHKHTAIYLDRYNNMFIHTDKGRCVRPLLVLDNQKRLVIDVNNWWDKDIEFLLSNGAMEYIDSMEIQSYRVAPVINRIQELVNNTEQLKNRIAQLPSMIDDLELDISQQRVDSAVKNDPIALDEAMKKLIDQLDDLKTEYDILANKIDQLQRPENQYSYCELHPSIQLDVISATIPLVEYSQSSKIIGQANMTPQATAAETTHSSLYPGGSTRIFSARLTRPLVTTAMDRTQQPYGTNLLMAFGTFGGHTIEDALIMNENSINKLKIFKQFTISVPIPTTSGVRGESVILTLGKPSLNNMDAAKREKFRWLEDNGLPFINAPLEAGDVAVGIIKSTGGIGSSEDNSRTIKPGEEGTVWRINVGEVRQKRGMVTMVSITIRRYSIPIEGYKFTPRDGQKGTVGKMLKEADMPRTANGSVPDIIINTHCIKRMTVNYILELLLGTKALFQGRPIDATPMEEFNMDDIIAYMNALGFKDVGYETLYIKNSKGELVPMQTLTFLGVVYLLTLKHIAEAALRFRADGPRDASTRQGAKTGNKAAFKVNRHDNAGSDRDEHLKPIIQGNINDADSCWTSYCVRCKDLGTSGLGCAPPSCVRCQAGSSTMRSIYAPYAMHRVQQFVSVTGVLMKIGEAEEGYAIPEDELEELYQGGDEEGGDADVTPEEPANEIDQTYLGDEEGDGDYVLGSGSEDEGEYLPVDEFYDDDGDDQED